MKGNKTELDILVASKQRWKPAKGEKKQELQSNPVLAIESFEDLLKRDEQREKDGFQKKIKIGKIMASGGKVIMVPNVSEEKLVHGQFEPNGEHDDDQAGHGEGETDDVIRRRSIWGEDDDEGDGDEEGEPNDQAGRDEGEHGIEAEAYNYGKELSEKFQLPNLKDKGKKVPTDEYIYDLTDRHTGSGQLLDKKATLRRIVRTNAALGRYDVNNVDPSNFVVGPQDKVYRVLSKERVWKSQAIVFFARDYSGSMIGEPTKAVVTQHLMIYSWLSVQYEKLVIPRYIVHDEDAKEVSINDYFRKSDGGGTLISSAFKKINEIVDGECLARDYNIYIFYGTDGDNSPVDYKNMNKELEKILGYINRMGVSVLKKFYRGADSPYGKEFEENIKKNGFLDKKDIFRMHSMSSAGVTDEKNIEAVKALIAQD